MCAIVGLHRVFVSDCCMLPFLGRQRCAYIVFRNRLLYGFMFVYIYMYICMYVYIYICQDGGAVGFVDLIKLSFALSLHAQPFDQIGSISEYVFVILSQCKAYTRHFQKETARKTTGPITKWPLWRLLFTL